MRSHNVSHGGTNAVPIMGRTRGVTRAQTRPDQTVVISTCGYLWSPLKTKETQPTAVFSLDLVALRRTEC